MAANSIHADSDTFIKQLTGTTPDFDSFIVIQKQHFHIQLWVDTLGNYDETSDVERNNTFLLIQKGNQRVFSDSMSTAMGITDVEIVDLNNDGNLDISIFKESGGRMANIFAYWFLYNPNSQSFNRIAGLDSLPTVHQDSTGLVVSHAFYGELLNETYFFIDRKFQLIDLKEEVETLEFDDTTNRSKETFDKAFKKYQHQKDK